VHIGETVAAYARVHIGETVAGAARGRPLGAGGAARGWSEKETDLHGVHSSLRTESPQNSKVLIAVVDSPTFAVLASRM